MRVAPKKPTFEAIKVEADTVAAVHEFTSGLGYFETDGYTIATRGSQMHVPWNWWLMRDASGNCWPVSPDEFTLNYDEVP